MAEDMAARVLANKVAQISSQAHVRDGTFVVAPFLDRDAFEQDEALAMQEIPLEFGQIGAQFWKDKVGLCPVSVAGCIGSSSATYLGDTGQRGLGRHEIVGSSADLVNILRSESVSPFLRVVSIVLGLPDRRAGDLFGEGVEGPEMFVQRRMLTGGFQPIRKDIQRGREGMRSGWDSVSQGRSHVESVENRRKWKSNLGCWEVYISQGGIIDL